jgi:hypothetical protein
LFCTKHFDVKRHFVVDVKRHSVYFPEIKKETFAVSSLFLNLLTSQIGDLFLPHPVASYRSKRPGLMIEHIATRVFKRHAVWDGWTGNSPSVISESACALHVSVFGLLHVTLPWAWSCLADLVDPGIRRSGYHTAETTTLKLGTVAVDTTDSRLTQVTVRPAGRHPSERCLMSAMARICQRPFIVFFFMFVDRASRSMLVLKSNRFTT